MLRKIKFRLYDDQAQRKNRCLKPFSVTQLHLIKLNFEFSTGESPILESTITPFHLWKTSSKLWRTCGEGVEKPQIFCGKDVE
jgi:hypothetical protein